MKTSAIGPAVIAGEKILVGEFRDWGADEKPVRDQPGRFHVFEKAYVVIGRDSVEVTNFVRDGKRLADLHRPAVERGALVAIRYNSFARSPYGTRAEGTIEPLEK